MGGEAEFPLPRSTWKRHYSELAASWMHREYDRTGRVLMCIGGCIYDATLFLPEHPGDPQVLLAAVGTDATEAFHYIGHSHHAHRVLAGLAAPELDLPYEGRLLSVEEATEQLQCKAAEELKASQMGSWSSIMALPSLRSMLVLDRYRDRARGVAEWLTSPSWQCGNRGGAVAMLKPLSCELERRGQRLGEENSVKPKA